MSIHRKQKNDRLQNDTDDHSTMIIYLLAGYAGSGKSTAGEILQRACGSARSTAFGKAVKDGVAKIYSIDRELCDTQEGKRTLVTPTNTLDPVTVRQLLISYSAYMKRISDDYWAKLVVEEIMADRDVPWVIHDWRYRMEYDTLKDNFPYAQIVTIRIVRSGVIPLDEPSEHDLDAYKTKLVIYNDGSVEDLERCLRNTLIIHDNLDPWAFDTDYSP